MLTSPSFGGLQVYPPAVGDRAAVELKLVSRKAGMASVGACGSCQQVSPLPFGIFVGSDGEPCGAVEVCEKCGPRAETLMKNVVGLLPDGAGTMLHDA